MHMPQEAGTVDTALAIDGDQARQGADQQRERRRSQR